MPKKKILTEDLTRVVSMRMDQQTWAALVEVARSQGLSASSFMRSAVFSRMREQGVEPNVRLNRKKELR